MKTPKELNYVRDESGDADVPMFWMEHCDDVEWPLKKNLAKPTQKSADDEYAKRRRHDY